MHEFDLNARIATLGGGYMTTKIFPHSKGYLFAIILLAGIIFLAQSSPVHAYRNLEWRDGELWVVSDPTSGQEDIIFPPLADAGSAYWMQPVAVMSPDDEWVAFNRNTGGGFEGEGQSCYIARWNGEDERLLLETTRIIENIWWMEGDGKFFIAMQLVTGGTAYRSFFRIVEVDTGQIHATVEGRIYSTSRWGARYNPGYFDSVAGLRYEVLSFDEEPYRWGIYYVDELIRCGPTLSGILEVDGTGASQHKLTDGDVRTAWTAETGEQSGFTITFDPDYTGRSILIQSGYQWHEPPPDGGMPWDAADRWNLYDRPRKILVTFSNGEEMEIFLEDTRSVQTFYFPEGYPLDQVEFTVLTVYRGIEIGRVAISEIFVY